MHPLFVALVLLAGAPSTAVIAQETGAPQQEAAPPRPQDEPPAKKEKKKEKEKKPEKVKKDQDKDKDHFKLRFDIGAEIIYDDNVYNLDDDRKRKLDRDNEPNNRFDRMNSSDDLLVRPSARLRMDWRSFGGRDAGIRLESSGSFYFENDFNNYYDFGARFSHELWKRGEIFLEGDFTPKRFRKNYFETGIDGDGNGDISKPERIYDHGIYQEVEVLAGLRSRLAGILSGEVAVGYRTRDYRSPFRNRDEEGFIAETGLELDFWDWVILDVTYRFEDERTDDGLEDVLIDETAEGDVDGIPGLDPNALVRTPIDRSNRSHEFGAAIAFQLTKNFALKAFYRYRLRDFTSDESLDLNHRDREDRRHTAGAEIEYRLASWAELSVRYIWSRNLSDRHGDDPLGEELTYTRNVASVGLLLRF